MKIDANSPASLVSTAWSGPQAGNNAQAPTDSESGDRVTVGSNGALVASLAAQPIGTSQAGTDRVAQLREAINSGTYTPDPQAIADGIIRNGE